MESNKVNFSNFLLFASQYMLIPVLPVVMAKRLDVSIALTGLIFVVITAGMFLMGPVYSYLADAFKRKHVCILGYCVAIAATAGYIFVDTLAELFLLALIQGAAFGVATSTGIILAIDITPSPLRSKCNVRLGWYARLGMMAGVTLGVLLYMGADFMYVIYTSIAIGVIGMLGMFLVHVPFRAPIGSGLLCTDRFLLPRGTVPAFNMLLIAFIPGLLFPLIHLRSNDVIAGGVSIPFFAWVMAGFLLSVLLVRYAFRKEKTWAQIVTGILLTVISMSRIVPETVVGETVNAVVLGIGLGLVTPEFMLIFIRLSNHCQRSTANTNHLLAWEAGSSLGIAAACYLNAHDSYSSVYLWGTILAVVALLYFVLVTYPYYQKKRVR